MLGKLKIFSLIFIYCGVCILCYIYFHNEKDVFAQEKLISEVFYDSKPNFVDDYLGYIYIPRFNIKRLIKEGTDRSILDSGFVGMHKLSGCLSCDDLIILAGHNIKSVFSNLHVINIGDVVYINSYNFSRKFIVYDKKIVNEYDFNYLVNNRISELLLITCSKNKGDRLLVFLREDL